MGKCLKGKSTVKQDKAKVKCTRCGALSEHKKEVCDAEKIPSKGQKKDTSSKKKK